ncbi:42225_t:CDS:1, partial [Gigaspora margarita]
PKRYHIDQTRIGIDLDETRRKNLKENPLEHADGIPSIDILFPEII